MSLKIPRALFIKLEGQKLIDKIKTEFGFETDYKKGSHLILYYNDKQILNLASDTLEFWTTSQSTLTDYVCIIENKKAVWKYHNDYARKVVHLFAEDLNKLENAKVKMNKSLKKNVSMIEIICSYDDFKTVEPKIENINRGVENLHSTQIDAKHKDKAMTRKFVEACLDNEKFVLCIYHEKGSQLEIFGKTEEYVEKTAKEFSKGSLKMTTDRTKGATPASTKTTVFQINAGSFEQPDDSKTELGKKQTTSFVESSLNFSSSLSVPKSYIPGIDALSKKQPLARSVGTKRSTADQMADSLSIPNISTGSTDTDSQNQPLAKRDIERSTTESSSIPGISTGSIGTVSNNQPLSKSIGTKETTEDLLPDQLQNPINSLASSQYKDVTKTNVTMSRKASDTQYTKGLLVGSGSNFLYTFTIGGLNVSVYPHSIVNVKDVDALVNAANDVMVHGGGVAYHISKAAGKQMDDEGKAYVRTHGKLKVGENCVTSPGRLSYKGIIHAVGPQWVDYIGKEDRCAEDLYLTVKNTLQAAKDKRYRSIALCAISAGEYLNTYAQ